MSQVSPVIQTTGLSKSVTSGESQLQILQAVDITVKKAESVAILGKSGAGKSTLLSLLAGLDTATTGSVYFEQQDLGQLTEDQRTRLRASKMAFIFQSFHLIPSLTALQNVMLPLEINGERKVKSRALAILEQVGLTQRMHHYPSLLSGGEQQRVAIARAFVTQPQVLFADEPTGNLDSSTGATIIDLLFDLNKQHQTTLVMVTHDDNLANRCQRKLYITSGQLKEQA